MSGKPNIQQHFLHSQILKQEKQFTSKDISLITEYSSEVCKDACIYLCNNQYLKIIGYRIGGIPIYEVRDI